jgi:hypothetical protein
MAKKQSELERNKRRAAIVRRWAAYRTGQAQREIWRKRRGAQADDPDEGEETVCGEALLVDLPESLLG